MANKKIDFGIPKSSSVYSVQTTGTVDSQSTLHVMVSLNVTNTGTSHTRNDTFYTANDLVNTTFTPTVKSGTCSIVIVPKYLTTSETVAVTTDKSY